MRRAVLLVNLGTPDAATVPAVRTYLREFLSDPRVVDMNPVGRWFLLNFVILPFRPKKSAHAYQQIWTSEGSPLMVWSEKQREGLAARLAGDAVLLAMRYGNPSLSTALDAVDAMRVSELVVVPLFPQNASATTGSVTEAIFEWYRGRPRIPAIRVVPPFFSNDGFLHAFTRRIQDSLAGKSIEHVVFSYHGLPERQVLRADGLGHCLASETCCNELGTKNELCYRAQCFATTRALTKRLGLTSFSTTFQSRLGRTPWIRPHTDETLDALAKKGLKRVAVVAPAFVADCLETLEELGLRAAARFKAQGGEALTLVPCLNADERWLDALAELVQ